MKKHLKKCNSFRSRRNPTPPDIERNVLQLISLLSKATGEKFQSPISGYNSWTTNDNFNALQKIQFDNLCEPCSSPTNPFVPSVYIDGMLTMSMSSALTQCLATIHANVPGLRNQIQGYKALTIYSEHTSQNSKSPRSP